LSVPKLRFPEFGDAGEWVGGVLANLIDSLDAGVSVNSEDTPPLSDEYSILKTSCISGNTFNINERKVVRDSQEIKRLKEPLQNESIVISRMNTPLLVGASAYVDVAPKKTFLPDRLWQLRLSKIAFTYWLACWLSNERNHERIRASATGTSNSMKNINKSGFLNLEIFYPSLSEQQKIADCLSSLDDRITAETQKLDTLKLHKKGLMQQLFPAEGESLPKLRFPEFRNVGEWEENQLNFICHMQAGKFVSASDISEKYEKGLYPCYGGNGLRGYTKTYTHSGNYPLIGRQGALCGNVKLGVGQFHATEHAVVATPKDNIDINWLFYELDLLNLNRYATGQAQPGLSVDVLEKIPITVPEIKNEQEKIADCLSSLDDLITAQTQKIDTLKVHKKGLMQQLFPSVNGEEKSAIIKDISMKDPIDFIKEVFP
jgi:type I restriction enzyme, S subunit